jgi:hypothetical protein
MSSEKIK